MRRKNPYADLSALLETTRKLTDEEMAELQLELGYARRALLIYERLLLADPRNAFYRRRCEWLARLLMASEPTVRRPAAPASEARRAKGEPTPVHLLEIITVGQ